MAVNTNPIFIKGFNNKGTTIQNAQGTELQTIFTSATDGSRVIGISAISDETAEIKLDLYFNDGTADFLIGVFPIKLTDGSIDILNSTKLPFLPKDNNSNQYLTLKTGESFKMKVQSAVPVGKKITIVTFGGNY